MSASCTQVCYEHHGATETPRLEQKFEFLVRVEEIGGSHGSNYALPECGKRIVPGGPPSPAPDPSMHNCDEPRGEWAESPVQPLRSHRN